MSKCHIKDEMAFMKPFALDIGKTMAVMLEYL